MGTPAVPGRGLWRGLFPGIVLLSLLAASPGGALRAQSLPTAGGKTATFGYFNPAAPVAKAPSVAYPPYNSSPMPAVSPQQYLLYKSALAPFAQSSFAFPPRVESTPANVPPFAPSTSATSTTPTPTYSWEGIQDTGTQPPSPDLAVGPSDVLMAVNSSIAQFTRTGTLKKLTTFQDWFASVFSTICPSGAGQCLLYDPSIRYDQLHGRFLFLATARDFQARQGLLMLSVSNGATFDSGWKIWVLDPRVNGSIVTDTWADFWRLGFDNLAVYLSGNLYNQGSNAFVYGKIRVLKKSELYNSSTTSLTFNDMWNFKNDDGTSTTAATAASSLAPVLQRGKPNAVNGGYFVNASDTVPATFLTVWQIANPLAATLTATRSTISGLRSYSYPVPAPQANAHAVLDSGDTRVLKAIYRNGFLYTARDTGYTDATTSITYDLIDTSAMTAVSQARVLNANVFYPAFDVPATTPPGTPVASNSLIYGTTTASDGSLTYAGIFNLKAGEGVYDASAGGLSRWGDYFGGAVDPVGGGLWVSGEYAKAPLPTNFGHWGTWAGYFPASTTPVFSDVDPTSPFADYINILSLWQITSGCSTSPAKFCPNDPVTRAQLAVFIIRSMFGSTFTYTTTPYFTDVAATDAFFPYIQKMRDLGITSGCTATTFCPGDSVTRWAASILIIRGKMAALFGDKFPYPTTPYFTDVSTTALEFPFIQKMAELGITSGCNATAFCPSSLATRQQIAVFLTRAFLN